MITMKEEVSWCDVDGRKQIEPLIEHLMKFFEAF